MTSHLEVLRAALLSFLVLHLALASYARPGYAALWDSGQSPLSPLSEARGSDCPPCFNCNLDNFNCLQYANCTSISGKCSCPVGFGGPDCGEPTCGSLARGDDRAPRTTSACDCDEGWMGINCNVCASDGPCGTMMDTGQANDAVCYTGADVVRENFQMCDITNTKILDTLKERKPQATFTCNAERKSCDFQFWVDQEESFYCALEQCGWATAALSNANKTTYHCQNLKCKCIPGRMLCGAEHSIDISEFLDVEIRGPAKFISTRRGNGIQNDSSIFSEPAMDELIASVFGDESIFLSCRSGECLNRINIPGYSQPKKEINAALVTAIVVSCSAVLLAFTAFVYFLRKRTQHSKYGPIHLDSDATEEFQRMLINHKPTSIHFERVSYRIGSKQILSDICGAVHSGEVLAIMGASGAGKTSLLDLLARKNKRGRTTGDFLLNGEKLSDEDFNKVIGFVDQDDTMLSTLTVHETILDSALLRLPRTMGQAAKLQRVEEVEKQLGIYHIRNQVIGSEEGAGRGISGGEKRRVAIACELVTSPSILFLDEPTSGLDAYNAHNVIECLTTLAKTYGRTVVFTIHQPRSNIVSLFDQLILLAQGRVVYSGPFRMCSGYFESIGFRCPDGFNIADYIIDLSMKAVLNDLTDSSSERGVDDDVTQADPASSTGHIGFDQMDEPSDSSRTGKSYKKRSIVSRPPYGSNGATDDEAALQTTAPQVEDSVDVIQTGGSTLPDLDLLNSAYSNSQIARDLKLETNNLVSAASQAVLNNTDMLSKNERTKSSSYARLRLHQQFAILSRRTWRNLYRNPLLMLTHYATAIILAVFIGFLFYDLTDDLAGFQNRLGFFFFILALFGFSTLTSLTAFAPERLLFVRERAKGYYNPLAYYLAKVFFDVVPLRLLPPCILGCIVYPMTGLVAAWSEFSKCILFIVLFNLAAAAICLFLGICIKNPGVANLVGVLVMLFSLLFGGFLLNHETISKSVAWLQYLSIYHFAFEGLIVNEVRYLSLVDKQYGLNIQVPGSAILSSFGFKVLALWEDVFGLAIFCIAFLVLGYMALHFLLVEKR